MNYYSWLLVVLASLLVAGQEPNNEVATNAGDSDELDGTNNRHVRPKQVAVNGINSRQVTAHARPPTVSSMEDDHNPCYGYRCKKPSYAICISKEIDGVLQPVCECPESCPDIVKPVCSVYGKQYDSLCHLRLFACKKQRSYPLAYQKPCVASQEPCSEFELNEFPHRLLEWFLHLREIDELRELNPNSNIRKLTNAGREKLAKWKFDLLDRKHDGLLDRRDLREFRYGLMPLEHCAEDFFNGCSQGSKTINLEQWNTCLRVDDVEGIPKRVAELFLNVVPKQTPVEEEDEE